MKKSSQRLGRRPPLEAMADIRLDKVLLVKRNIANHKYSDPELIGRCADRVLDEIRKKMKP